MARVIYDHVSKVYARHNHAVSDISLNVNDGELMVMVGPSGCGKSTSLRMIAGLETVTAGNIHIGDDVVTDWPSQKRDVAMVFQTHALYPTMTVAENLGFPLRMSRLSKAEVEERVARVADRLSLRALLPRNARQLSVGEKQRVAMGRAIVRHPRVFLMDEPLSSLDAPMRVQTRVEILELQRELGVTTLYVTHDQVEAMTMGDRVAVMRDGEILQCAPPQELYDLPASTFVAAFIGSPRMNLFHTTLVTDADGVRWVRFGRTYLSLNPQVLQANVRLRGLPDGPVIVGARPEALSAAPPARTDNTIDVTVTAVEMLGSESLAYFEADVDVLRWSGSIDTMPTARHGAHEAPGGSRSLMCARLWPPVRLPRGTALRLAVDTRRFYFFAPDGRLIH